jgi:hypothetical protein
MSSAVFFDLLGIKAIATGGNLGSGTLEIY